ncbi:MAG: MBL fold metallo-hydrolase [Bdellovibrionales bacterium]|nr:MBL fold metallo-hydrolase [Bdellovibrionales bacterium]
MKLTFLGAAQGVTGSKTLLELEHENYLIDYGLFQGGSKVRAMDWNVFQRVNDITAIFLTHAHIDHSGLLPRLASQGYEGKIYSTPETFELCKILLMDSAKIHQEDAEYANKKKFSRHSPALPLYTEKDAEKILSQFETVEFNQATEISPHLTIEFFWAGHILGASFLKLTIQTDNGPKKIVFSGDIGHDRNVLLKKPSLLCECDFLVLESTYGDRLHPRTSPENVLELFLRTILKRDGVAVIPSFSVGRTQDILYLIKKLIDKGLIPSVPVYLDSPLSRKANSIFKRNLDENFIKADVLTEKSIFPSTLMEIETVRDSKNLNELKSQAMIIVSASGMLDGGRVVHHVKSRIEDKKNGIIFVGYQPEGTKGRILINGEKKLRLHKEDFRVEADIFYVDALSAHADYLDTIGWLKESKINPRLIILNHGEHRSLSNLKTLLESEFDYKVTIADFNESFTLDSI